MATTIAVLIALAVAMALAIGKTIQQLRLVIKDPDSLAASHHVVRAIRAGIFVACSVVFMAAVVWSSKNLVILGAIILAEEIYETGLVSLIIRSESTAG